VTVTIKQVRILMKEKAKGSLRRAAMKSNMCEKTARKHVKSNKTSEELRKARIHRTRPDPFQEHWAEVLEMLERSPTLEAQTIMSYLQETYPQSYKSSQIRTLQRRLSVWRVEHGPSKIAIFRQKYNPGRQSQSDWTHMKSLNITIGGEPFEHLLYHYVMSYSGFESFMICYSESFETLTKGYELAVLEAGGVCREHRTDNLTAATQASGNSRIFTSRWSDFTAHYGVLPTRNNPGESHENGVVEKSHDLLKKAVEQELLLRRYRDFRTLEDYQIFLNKLKEKRNFARREKIAEEQRYLNPLPDKGFNEATLLKVCVSPDSLVHILGVVYSVPSRLIGSWLKAYAYRDKIDLFLGDKLVLTLPRLEAGVLINYRHLVDSLIRKPRAFENYQYHSHLFPNLSFRKAYDAFKNEGTTPSKRYCELLYLAKMEGEQEVTAAIDLLLEIEELPLKDQLSSLVASARKVPEVKVNQPPLEDYDVLLTGVVS
jgi:transposase